MSDTIGFIIQIIAGIAGGNAIGKGMVNIDLGPTGNTIAGAIGGAVGGQLLQALIPALGGDTAGFDIGDLVGQLVGGGAGGAIVTIIAGLLKNTTGGQQHA